MYTSQSSSLCNNLLYASSVEVFFGVFCFQAFRYLYPSDILNDKFQTHKTISNFYLISSSLIVYKGPVNSMKYLIM